MIALLIGGLLSGVPAPPPPVEIVIDVPEIDAPLVIECATGYISLDNRLTWHSDPDGGYRGPQAEPMVFGAQEGCEAGYTVCYDFSQPPPQAVERGDVPQCPWVEDFTKIPPAVVP